MRRPRPPSPRSFATALLLALLLSVALAPPSAAQTPPVALALDPAEGTTNPGGSTQTTVLVRNDGTQPVVVRLDADAPKDVSVDFAEDQLTVLPAQTVSTRATFLAGRDMPSREAAHEVIVRATIQEATTQQSSANVTASYHLTVRAPFSGPPLVDTSHVNVSAYRNAITSYALQLGNPTNVSQTLDIEWNYPRGWEARGGLERLTLQPHETREVEFPLVAREFAVDGRGQLRVRMGHTTAIVNLSMTSPPIGFELRLSPDAQDVEENGTATYRVDLRAERDVVLDLEYLPRPGFSAVLEPSRVELARGQTGFALLHVTTTRAANFSSMVDVNATDALTQEEHHAFATIRVVADGSLVSTPVEPDPEPEYEAQPEPEPEPERAPDDEGENTTTSAPEEVVPEPVGEGPVFEVLPRVLEIPQGGEARATVHLRRPGADGSGSVTLRVELPPKVSGGLDTTTLALLPPANEAAATLTLRSDPDTPIGAEYGGRVLLDDGTLTAAFRVRIVPPLPASEVDVNADGASIGLADARLQLAVATAGVGALAVGLVRSRRRWSLAFAALYARLAPSRVLAHKTRQRLLDEVRREPGVPLGVVQRRLGLANGAMAHHAHMLERAGHLVSFADGGLRRLYPMGAPRPAPARELPDRVLDELRAHGPLSAAELARRLDVTRQAVHYHAKKMLEDGRLVTRQDGRDVLLALPLANAPRR